jgi:hypothetical protein
MSRVSPTTLSLEKSGASTTGSLTGEVKLETNALNSSVFDLSIYPEGEGWGSALTSEGNLHDWHYFIPSSLLVDKSIGNSKHCLSGTVQGSGYCKRSCSKRSQLHQHSSICERQHVDEASPW